MRLVLCDDNRILCEALAAGLQARGHHVAGIATTALDGVRAVAAHQPEVCLLDLCLCGSPDGLAAASAIRKHYRGTKVLVLSGVTEQATLERALDIGVVGFLRKDQDVSQIADALDVVAKGGLVMDAAPRWARPRTTQPPREQPPRQQAPRQQAPREQPPRQQAPRELTPRESEVLHRIAAGQDSARMVREMEITVSTLHTYVKSVLAKLGAHSRLQAAALASREGLLGDTSGWNRGASQCW